MRGMRMCIPPFSICTLRKAASLVSILALIGGAFMGLRRHGQTMGWAEHTDVMLLKEDMTMQIPNHLHPTAPTGFAY